MGKPAQLQAGRLRRPQTLTADKPQLDQPVVVTANGRLRRQIAKRNHDSTG